MGPRLLESIPPLLTSHILVSIFLNPTQFSPDEDLNIYPKTIESDLRKLLDYKVRVVDEGQDTKAVVRVLIESTDGRDQWQTVGASSNIIEASWMALADSFEYFLIHS